MNIKTNIGQIQISPSVIAKIAGHSARKCFGVKEMTSRNFLDELCHLFSSDSYDKGVKVSEDLLGGVSITLHIAVKHGVNINVVCRSIINEVRYNVERLARVDVNNVNIYVDCIKPDLK